MKFNKPHQQQIQQQTMMNHQLINQGMPSVASIWEATRAMISTQEVAQDWGKQSLREANTQPPPPQHTQHSLSWSAQVAQQSIPGTSSGLFNTNPAHQQPQVQSVQIQQQQQQQQQHHQQQQQQTHHQQQPRQQEYVLLSNEFNYDCEHCSFSGTSKENLQDHMRLHAAERPHICGICGLSFTYKDSLEKHMSNHKVKAKTYPCTSCSMVFSSRSDQQAHALTHAINCEECSEQFMDQASLNQHKKVHNVKKGPMLPFMCALCKTGSATSKELSAHMKEYHTPGGGGGSSKTGPPAPREGKRNAPRNLPQQEAPSAPKEKKMAPPRVVKKATVPIYSEDVTVLQPDGKLVQYKERPWKCAKCRKGFQLPGHLKVHVRKCVPSSI